MPPKNKYQKEDIIKAAFEIFRKHGLEKVSARSIAKKLKTSTSPIFAYFKNMNQFNNEFIKMTADLLYQYQTTPITREPFLDMGIGYIKFAKKEKILFQAMSKTKHISFEESNSNKNRLLEAMKKDPTLVGLNENSLELILLKMWIFVHGIAGLMNIDALPNNSDEFLINFLQETGNAIIKAEKEKNNFI